MTKNITALTLALLLTLTAASCGGNANSDETTSGDAGTTAADTEKDIYSDLPTGDFGGYEFNILNHSYTYAEYRLDSDSITGETFNDAVYNRTREVEEKLSVKIVIKNMDYWSEKAESEIMNLVMAGDDVYDCCFLGAAGNVSAITGGIYLDLRSVKEFDFSKPWWDKKSLSYYDINGKVYTALNEASANIHDQMWTAFFNKSIAENLKIDNIYELVRSGKWTLDKMAELIETAASDIDGDGKLGADDRWGLMTHYGSSFGFLHGADARAIESVDGIPTLVKLDDHLLGTFEKIRKIFSLDGVMTNNKHQSAFGYTCVKGFSDNKSLFLVEVLGNAASLRGMDMDFGIIPYPKYDEAQQDYISYYSPAANGVCIPKTCSDVSRAGTVIEVMSALGYKYIRPAYYEIVLNGKTIRDDESREMLDIIFENIESDFAKMYKWADYDNTLTSVMTSSADIASTLESKKKAVETAIEEFINSTK